MYIAHLPTHLVIYLSTVTHILTYLTSHLILVYLKAARGVCKILVKAGHNYVPDEFFFRNLAYILVYLRTYGIIFSHSRRLL